MKYIHNEIELNEVTKSGITIVDFYADWCGPCRMISPVLEELADERNDINIVKVDVDEARELAMKYKISAIPAILFFKEGNLAKHEIGFMTKEDLNAIISEISA